MNAAASLGAPADGARFDCIVVGGGSAGCAAAAAAATAGCSTLLVERHGFLGGMGTAAGLSAFINYRYRATDLSHSFYRAILADLAAHEATYNTEHGNVDVFEPEALKLVLEARLAAAGVELALHTAIFRIWREAGEWTVQVFQKSGLTTLRARYIVDATGDADVAARAGAGVTHGRKSDGKTQPLTMVVQLGGAAPEEFGRRMRPLVDGRFIFHSDCLGAEIAAARTRGEWRIPRDNVAMFWSMPWDPTRVTINGTRILGLSACRGGDLSTAERLGRQQAWELASFFRKYVPGFGRATLLQTGPQVGVRETRRIVGRETLSETDVLSSRQPEDLVVLCSYPIDVHQPDGTGSDFDQSDDYCYGIPLRCLLPADVPNLIAAGRCISATHEAAGSFRVMSTCMNLGEAAGTTVGVALSRNQELAEVEAGEVRARMHDALAETAPQPRGAALP
jgi:glycine/D-amino acid oxidase-like deaminating enzyme